MASAVMNSATSLAPVPHADRTFAAFLFDMDGTLITSIASANRAWTQWAQAMGIDPAHVISIMHGVRTVETMRRLGVDDPEREAEKIARAEIEDVSDVTPIAGVREFLAAIPAGRWAIVTSAGRALAEARLAAAGIPAPAAFVTAEDVEHGKPAPDCFLLGAARLGVEPAACLVFEDTAAGLAAADAAGMAAVAITATHDHRLDTPHPAVTDYRAITVGEDREGLRLTPR